MEIIAKILPAFGAVIFVLVLIVVTQKSLVLFKKWISSKNENVQMEKISAIFGAISLIYSLLIAFAIIAVWENYEELNKIVESETDQLNNIIVRSSKLPPAQKMAAFNFVLTYCQNVLYKEWSSSYVEQRFTENPVLKLRLKFAGVEFREVEIQNEMNSLDDNLSDLADLRKQRLSHTRSHIPVMIWGILIISSILTIGFSFFLFSDNHWTNSISLSFLTAIIGISLALVFLLDSPFTCDIGISNKGYGIFLSRMQSYYRGF